MTKALTDFAEIRRIITAFPGPDHAAIMATETRDQTLTKPPGALGRLEELATWLAAWQGHHPPRAEHPRICVFAGNHGVAARGVSAFPQEVTKQMVANFLAGGAAVNQLSGLIDADLQVYELDLDHPTADFTQTPAMDEAECCRAIAYGMTAVVDGLDILCVGEMGIANTTSGAAIVHALFGGAAEDWTGAGTGVTGSAYATKIAAVRDGVALHHAYKNDPLEILRRLGGRELAAIVGAIIAARMARTPVLLDGYTTTAAAAILWKIDPTALDHCQVGHLSAEGAHRRLCEAIGKKPILDLGMRLGETSGAALAVSVLKAATACHKGMATFAEAAVSGKKP